MTIAPLATPSLPRTGTSPNARADRQDESGHPWLTLAVIAMLVWLLWPAAFGGRFGLVIVDGNSMQPTYEPGDIVVTWRKPVEVGAPVFMRVPEGQPFAGIPVIHRVLERDARGWVTQGDNSPAPDAWRLQDEDVLGEAVWRLPGAGTMIRRALDPRILGLLVGAVIVSMMWPEKEQRPVRAPGVLHIPVSGSARRSREHRDCELFDPECACRRPGEQHQPSSAEEEPLFAGAGAHLVPSSEEAEPLQQSVGCLPLPSSAEDDHTDGACDLFDPGCACRYDEADPAMAPPPRSPLSRRDKRDVAHGARHLPLGPLPPSGPPKPPAARRERPSRVG